MRGTTESAGFGRDAGVRAAARWVTRLAVAVGVHAAGADALSAAARAGASLDAPQEARGAVTPASASDTSRFLVRDTAWNVTLRVERVAEGLEVPSAIVVLPDGRLLVTERPASRLRTLDPATGALGAAIPVGPGGGEVGEGLQEVALDPDFASNGRIWVSYTAHVEGGTTLAVDRARLDGDSLSARERIFTAHPPLETQDHFGGRIVFIDDHVFITSGDRLTRDSAQSLSTHVGKIVRLRRDGRVPADNPFVGAPGVLPEIWTLGHRNPQGLVQDPETGILWSHEHGPHGGDEINRIEPGRNYGWPRATHGDEYAGGPVGTGADAGPGLTSPLWMWRPSIAPSGLFIHSGRSAPGWRGRFVSGAMAGRHLNLLTVADGHVIHEERLLAEQGWRIRSVREGPDGAVYMGLDSGEILRVRISSARPALTGEPDPNAGRVPGAP